MEYRSHSPAYSLQGRDGTQLSEHATVAERGLDALTAEMLRTGTPPDDFIEVLVTDHNGHARQFSRKVETDLFGSSDF